MREIVHGDDLQRVVSVAVRYRADIVVALACSVQMCIRDRYDNDLREVWEVVKQNKSNPWDDGVNGEEVWFDLFDDFMCGEVV